MMKRTGWSSVGPGDRRSAQCARARSPGEIRRRHWRNPGVERRRSGERRRNVSERQAEHRARRLPGRGPVADRRSQGRRSTDGRIRVRGRGLLLASGNSIGQNANQRVFATLICEAAAPFVERNTALEGVALDPNGNFRIDDTLYPSPTDCASPVLLIRNTGGVWFAAGIPALGDD